MPILAREAVERQLPFGRRQFGLSSEDWQTLLEGDDTAGTKGLLDRETERTMDILNVEGNETAFEPTDETATFDGTGTDELPLPKRPVRDVTSVSVETRTSTYDLTPGDDVDHEETHLVLLRDAPISAFPDRRRSVTVEWTYGYEDTPGPVEEAFIRLVRTALDQIKTDGLQQEQRDGSGSWNYRIPPEIRAEAASTIRSYRPPSYYGGAMML